MTVIWVLLLKGWNVGRLECWNVGMLEGWNVAYFTSINLKAEVDIMAVLLLDPIKLPCYFSK